jgi:hypothetical protein
VKIVLDVGDTSVAHELERLCRPALAWSLGRHAGVRFAGGYGVVMVRGGGEATAESVYDECYEKKKTKKPTQTQRNNNGRACESPNNKASPATVNEEGTS